MIPAEKIVVGAKIKARWDGQISEIIAIDGDEVTYRCRAHDEICRSKDGLFRDPIEVIQRAFSIVEN